MTRIHTSAALFAAVLGVVAIAPNAVADEWNKKTIVTINEPMEVPGVTLIPGTYVFKLADSSSDRHIVVIQNENEDKTFATILAVPDYRIQPTANSRFLFWETPAGQPQALRAWFYPGDNFGQEFLYPKTRATQIAQTSSQEVPAAPAEQPAPAAQPEQPAVVAENTPPAEPAPAPAPAVTAPAEPAPAPAPAPAEPPVVAQNIEPQTLPQTASNLPLLALIGMISIGLALGLGTLLKRMN